MAALRSKVPPVGSAQWVLGERQQAAQYVEQEVEEFTFSVRNEMEWLNEHMSDIFSRNQLTVTEIFKTPGKLRGKTPRTARKRNPLETRAPLTDVFGPNTLPTADASPQASFHKSVAQFQVAEDEDDHTPASPPRGRGAASGGMANVIDSGYYGLSQDELENDYRSGSSRIGWGLSNANAPKEITAPVSAPIETEENDVEHDVDEPSHPDDEASGAASMFRNDTQEDPNPDNEDATMADEMDFVEDGTPVEPESPKEQAVQESVQFSISAETASAFDSVIQHNLDLQAQTEAEQVRSPSDGSSPIRPLVRKSSLNFAPLPGREPLTSKKSMGNRVSRTSHLDQARLNRSSHYGRFTGGKSLGGSQLGPSLNDGNDDAVETSANVGAEASSDEPGTARLHNKTSTQRLHERINALGQSKDRDSGKQNNNSSSHVRYPSITEKADGGEAAVANDSQAKPAPGALETQKSLVDDDDDWIAPIKHSRSSNVSRLVPSKASAAEPAEPEGELPQGETSQPSIQQSVSRPVQMPNSPLKPFGIHGHSKFNSVSGVPSPMGKPRLEQGHAQSISVPDSGIARYNDASTPLASPSNKRYFDAPLSASKAKVSSLFKTAKEKLIYTAGLSAQVKLDALPAGPSPHKQLRQAPPAESPLSPVQARPNLQDGLYPDITAAVEEAARSHIKPASPSKTNEPRRTRSSTEREEKQKHKVAMEQQKQDEELERLRERERVKATAQHARAAAESLQDSQEKAAASLKNEIPAVEQDEVRVADDIPQPPAPKSLLPTSQSQKTKETRRLVKPSKAPLPSTKPPPVIRVALNSRLGHASTLPAASSSKQAATAAKTSSESLRGTGTQKKGIEQAKKKREEERKAEEKRIAEEKRAAKIAEERRIEQQRREQREQREQEARRQAQKAAADAKQRPPISRAPSRQTNTLIGALQHEKQQVPGQHARADLGAARPISRMNTVPDYNKPIAPHMNPSKAPSKRPLQSDIEEQSYQRPTLHRAGPSIPDNKRRKTNEVEDEPVEAHRSVKAPPIRQSNVRKEPARFTHGYMTAPTPGHHTSSLLAKTLTAQHHNKTGHPTDMATISTARIPFAESSNSAAGPSASHNSSAYKTPARGAPGVPPQSVAKSSPQYPNPDNISLPEIATDSEDEDSEDDFHAPSWTDSPALREMLSQQQLVDPEQIFGPIAPLQMEEIFKNKDRHKRFRDRTSSANWSGSDRLTEEERRRDKEARERLVRDGGWSFNTTS